MDEFEWPPEGCIFCGGDCDNDGVCASKKCRDDQEREQREFLESERRYHIHQEWLGFRAALRDRGKCDENRLGRLTRWFYTAKTAICYLCGLRYRGLESWPKSLEMGIIYSRGGLGSWEASWIEVGRGVFTGWWYQIQVDGE
jgi:hypothetical protein